MKPRPRYFRDPVPLTASHSDNLHTFSNPSSSFSAQMSDALSSEWQKNVYYSVGDRVAFKLGSAPGVAAFECLRARTYLKNQINQILTKILPTRS